MRHKLSLILKNLRGNFDLKFWIEAIFQISNKLFCSLFQIHVWINSHQKELGNFISTLIDSLISRKKKVGVCH